MPYLLSFNIFLPVSNVQKLLLSVCIASTGCATVQSRESIYILVNSMLPLKRGPDLLESVGCVTRLPNLMQGRRSAVSAPLHQRP